MVLIAAAAVGVRERRLVAAKRSAVGLMSMSSPPIFALRSTNWAGVIRPFCRRLEAVLDADVVERQAGEAVAERLLLRAPVARAAGRRR